MRFQSAALCLFSTICVLSGQVAQAYVNTIENDDRTMTLFFDGTKEEAGASCEIRTSRLQSEINATEKSLGLNAGSIRITDVRPFKTTMRYVRGGFRCSYVVQSTVANLTFKMHEYDSQTGVNLESTDPRCLQDEASAQKVSGSIGASRWTHDRTLYVNTCTTNFATAVLK